MRVFDSSNALLETMVFLGGNGGQATYVEFYGAQNADIKSVTFDIIVGSFGTDWVKLDNFQFVPAIVNPDPVPEPATLLLVGSGLAALAVRRRRR